jgi:hypothetical protein
MMIRLLALLFLPFLAYYLVRSVSQRYALTPRQNQALFFITVALLVVGVLIALGRLPVQFILAPLGAAFAFGLRMLPTLLRLLPMWQMFKSRTSSTEARDGNQSSTIRTEYLAMELQHDSGDMDGLVLKGSYAERRLSSLSLHDLGDLYSQCHADADSSQVLEAYLERNHPDWRAQVGPDQQRQHVTDEAVMTRELALEILGLVESATRDEVTGAHRKLMQKMHPDRGGSEYLAKKINSAKDYLLDKL